MPRRMRLRRRPQRPEPADRRMCLVVGLGNPGADYAGTRHNIGAEIVDRASIDLGERLKRAPRSIRADIAEVRIGGERAVLGRPRTFMNDSGGAVAPLLSYFSVDATDLLVVHDDIDLPFARIRVQFGRGSGGNNGVESVIGSLRTQDFWRLKVGLGRPPGRVDPADFVLKRFGKTERDDMDFVVIDAVSVLDRFVTEGGEEAKGRAGEVNSARENS